MDSKGSGGGGGSDYWDAYLYNLQTLVCGGGGGGGSGGRVQSSGTQGLSSGVVTYYYVQDQAATAAMSLARSNMQEPPTYLSIAHLDALWEARTTTPHIMGLSPEVIDPDAYDDFMRNL